jgi:hypothetical protein
VAAGEDRGRRNLADSQQLGIRRILAHQAAGAAAGGSRDLWTDDGGGEPQRGREQPAVLVRKPFGPSGHRRDAFVQNLRETPIPAAREVGPVRHGHQRAEVKLDLLRRATRNVEE